VGQRGYYRHPTIHGDNVVFASEDDLWTVEVEGGSARRLTANPGSQQFPRFSPDGKQLAFTSRDEGAAEVFVMSAEGGSASRLSFFGATSIVAGWTPGGENVIAASDTGQPFVRWHHLWSVPASGGPSTPLGLGPASSIDHAPSGKGVVMSRHGLDPARWKRYRGGLAGTHIPAGKFGLPDVVGAQDLVRLGPRRSGEHLLRHANRSGSDPSHPSHRVLCQIPQLRRAKNRLPRGSRPLLARPFGLRVGSD
jgi:dipeptidyl aminopeptidase/acylaminoacyl peptidase